MDDFSIFEASEQMFLWSSGTPAEIIRFYAEDLVGHSLPGSTLVGIECFGEPKYLTGARNVAPSKIVVFGRSLGGAIAAYQAARQRPAALILESSFTSIPDMGAHLYPVLPVRLLSRFRYDTRESLQSVACPVLIVHSPDDEIIPFVNGEKLFEAANEPRSFLEIRGGHNEGFLYSGRLYRDGLDNFLSTAL